VRIRNSSARAATASDGDKATLSVAIRSLDESIDALLRIVDQYEALLLAKPDRITARPGPFIVGGDAYLSGLLFAVTACANLPLAQKLRRQTADATSALKVRTAKQRAVIQRLADQVWSEHPSWKLNRVAAQIEKPVERALGRALSRQTIPSLKKLSDRTV
jgi:hypothetical protein